MKARFVGLRTLLISASLLAAAGALPGRTAERLPYARSDIQPPTPEWAASVARNAPAQPTVKAPARRLLVFSLYTGFNHKVIPSVDRMFQILGRKSGTFTTVVTRDIEALTPERLAGFDVLVLNNNCSKSPRRNLFLDELERNTRYQDLTPAGREQKAAALEQSVLDFVAGGKGLVVIHGAVVMQNNSPKFTAMIGAAFDYHPPNQWVTVNVVEPDHPLVAAFRGHTPFIHRDEPYCFKGAYDRFDFHPLLQMDNSAIKGFRKNDAAKTHYVAWIKRHGKGRVFYCSPSHFPESYESPTLLRFILDGVQYAAGDLKCDDSPLKAKP
jgi:type 1 glutamine amidotransferase